MRTSTSLSQLLALVLALLIISAQLVYAQSTLAPDKKDQEIELLQLEVKQLEHRVDTLEGLDEKVKGIDSKLAAQGKAQQVELATERTKALETPLVRASDSGFRIQSADDDYRIRFAGLLQLNGRFFTSGNDKNVSSTFYVNKARPIINGALGKYFEFQVTPDFGQGKVSLQDGWVNVAYLPDAQLQVGKYKAYVNLERLQSDPALEFIQRSQVQNLVPNRDIGAQLWGILFNNRLTYQLALMNGVPNNSSSVDFDNNDAKDFVGRLFFTPFKPSENEWINGFGFGIAGSYGNERGTPTSIYKTWGQSTWFAYNNGVTYSGSRSRIDPQAYYYWRHFGLMAEYAVDNESVNLTASKVNKTDSFTNTGYMLQASYYLTGENASYSTVSPLRPFDPLAGGWGAWELAGRVSNVANSSRQFNEGFANQGVSAKTITEYAVGVNWILNNNVKYWFDYANSQFYEGAGTIDNPENRPAESVFESQFQLAF